MSNQRIALLFILLIFKTTVSLPLPRGDEQVPQLPPFQNIPSTVQINNSSLSVVNSNSDSGPLFNTYTIIGMTVGGVVAVIGVLALPALLGFTTAGIAATTTAATMMSTSAVASGGGVAAGSLVALLQSAGVLGVTASTGGLVATASAGTIGATIGFGLGYATEKVFKPVSFFFTNAHNETVAFFTGNGTKSWKSFANWTESNVDFAVFKIKNGTIESWEKVKVGTTDSWEKVKSGTVDSWNTVSDWTIVNTEKVTNKIKKGSIDAWNTISSWTTSSAAPSYTPLSTKIIFMSIFFNLLLSSTFLNANSATCAGYY